jgi:hypothetical protein
MARLVPATQIRGARRKAHGITARALPETAALLGGRDEPGHDVQKMWDENRLYDRI